METPTVRYVTTEDGVRIAYWGMGPADGTPPILCPEPMASNIQLELDSPSYRAFYEVLAKDGPIARYDRRGVGLSATPADQDRSSSSSTAARSA